MCYSLRCLLATANGLQMASPSLQYAHGFLSHIEENLNIFLVRRVAAIHLPDLVWLNIISHSSCHIAVLFLSSKTKALTHHFPSTLQLLFSSPQRFSHRWLIVHAHKSFHFLANVISWEWTSLTTLRQWSLITTLLAGVIFPYHYLFPTLYIYLLVHIYLCISTMEAKVLPTLCICGT